MQKSSLFLILLVFAVPCGADTITVNWDGSGDYTTIQPAIDAASDNDEIVVADGTYTGEGNRGLNFRGKAITLKSDNGPKNCIIDCQGTSSEHHRGFVFLNGEDPNSILDGFTITKGFGGYFSGGIYCSASSPLIVNCILKDNWAENGAGISNINGAQPIIRNCIFMENIAYGQSGGGGGMFNADTSPEVSNCLFLRNECYNSCLGGAMYSTGENSTPPVTNCTFVGNTAEKGGAIESSYDASPVYTNCIFWDNNASWAADEIRCKAATVTLVHCDIKGGWNGPGVGTKDGGVIINGGGNINANPLFVGTANDDYHLQPESPCIDAGCDGGIYDDMEGNVRPVDFPDVDNNGELPEFDIGAYEVVVALLTDLEIIGPDEVPDNNSAAYTATAYYDDGSATDVTAEAVWSVEPDLFAEIDAGGLLTTQQLDTPEEIILILTEYTEGEMAIQANKQVVIFANCSIAQLIKRDISGAVEIKKEVLKKLETALAKEKAAEDMLRQMQKTHDLGEWSFLQVVKARVKVLWAIIKEMWAERKIKQSKEQLDDSLEILNEEPQPEAQLHGRRLRVGWQRRGR